MQSRSSFAAVVSACILVLGLAACDSANPLDSHPAVLEEARSDHHAANVNAQLAAVRRATAQFQRETVALDAGYAEASPCVYHGVLGGMGIHYINFDLIGPPDQLDITKPQALLYEPMGNGRKRLVGVEYIVPFALSVDPPMLFGQHFHPGPPGWTLHVWIWQQNPLGMFADWNPKVSCEFADVAVDVTA